MSVSKTPETGQSVVERPRIIVGDDHTLLLDAMVMLLAQIGEVVGTASDGQSLLALLDSARPDVVITDLTMPGVSGFDVLRAIRERRMTVPVLVLTMHSDIGTLRTAMTAGAAGYLLKSAASSELADAVRTVLSGQWYIPPSLREAYSEGPQTGLEHLSLRQRAVLDAVARGGTNKTIAAELGITERTVAFHREQLRKRLGPLSAVEMVELLRRTGTPATD
jgi:DNA-binding NarL/FixJ family response regulator